MRIFFFFFFFRGNEIQSDNGWIVEAREGVSESVEKAAEGFGIFEEEASEGETYRPETTLHSDREDYQREKVRDLFLFFFFFLNWCNEETFSLIFDSASVCSRYQTDTRAKYISYFYIYIDLRCFSLNEVRKPHWLLPYFLLFFNIPRPNIVLTMKKSVIIGQQKWFVNVSFSLKWKK